MKLIVGLGNPGAQYDNTPHNIGFYILDSYLGNVTWSKKFNGLYYQTVINNEKYVFLKPQSYMNCSGEVVLKYMNYFKIDIEDLLVIQDDVELPLGKIRIKINSSAGGHNGIKDIIKYLHTDKFARVKIGLKIDTIKDYRNFVLGKMNFGTKKIVDENLANIYYIIENFDYSKTTDLMNKFN